MESVGRVLSCLPARARSVLELRFLHGYSVEETAQALGITPGNVKVIQHRALAKAADQMDYEAIAGIGETPRTQAIA
jgi:RNA polymerase sigma-70 factor (ECF subfamily)